MKIENLFAEIFRTRTTFPRQILITGIGSSQEPFSYMSSIKGVLKIAR